MAPKAVIPFLVGMMLLTGVCNTLLTKYQDMQCVRNCHSTDPKARKTFEQPVIQTAQMFIGEMGCWMVVLVSKVYGRWRKSLASGDRARGEYAPVGSSGIEVGRGTNNTASLDNGEIEDENEDEERVDVHRQDINPTTLLAESLIKPTAGETSEPKHQRIRLTGLKTAILAIPAICDILGTTLMNVGLLFVAASIYQMIRGALVLFVGLFSVVFLRRRLSETKWFALFVVVIGVAIVGLASVVEYGPSKADPSSTLGLVTNLVRRASRAARTPESLRSLIGVLFIAGAQIFTATQFVLEESIMENYELEPLKVVGWEGVFGFTVTVVGMLVLHLAVGRTETGRYGYFDMTEGLRELTHYRAIAASSLLIMVSIGGFNFFGLSVTRSVSATSRSTIDTCRTLFIWIVSLGLGWETFKWLQVVGFAGLVYGTFLFNDLIRLPSMRWTRRRQETLEDR